MERRAAEVRKDVAYPPGVLGDWQCSRQVQAIEGNGVEAELVWRALGGRGKHEVMRSERFATRFIAIADTRRQAAVVDRGYEYARRSGANADSIMWSAEQPDILRVIQPAGGGFTELKVLRRDVEPFQREPPYGFGYSEVIRITLARPGPTGAATGATGTGRGAGQSHHLLLARLVRSLAPSDDGSIMGTELISAFATAEGRAEDAMGRAPATSRIRSTVRLTRQRARPPRMRDEGVAASEAADGEAISAASACLAEYDAAHRAAAASQDARGFGGALTANEWADGVDHAPLADAVRVLWRAVSRTAPEGTPPGVDDGRLILGICAEDALAGVSALKSWVTALGLPKGPLHGMDRDGVPLDMSTFGAVYIKYNSLPPPAGGVSDPPGTARLSGYNGEFRGVYVNANLADGVFRQYAVLPLDLFTSGAPVEFAANSDERALAAAAAAAAAERSAVGRAVSETTAGSNTREGRSVGQQRKAATDTLNAANVRGQLQLLPEFTGLASLGIAVTVREACAEQGRVVLCYDGPENVRRAVEFNLSAALRQADQRVLKVEFAAPAARDS